MVDAVLVFGLINVIFEFIIVGMIPPRARLRLLGNRVTQNLFHVGIMVFVLWVHWGTVAGTMSGFFSFTLSIVTMSIARIVFGYIEGDNYRRGIIGYELDELR